MWTCHAVSKGHDIVSFLVSILDFSICSPVEGLFNWQVCHSEHSLTIVSALCPVSGTAELRAGNQHTIRPRCCVPASRQDSERIPDCNSLILDQFIFGRCLNIFLQESLLSVQAIEFQRWMQEKDECQPCCQIIAPQRFPYVRIYSKQ
jgi:hypothetical protein